MKHHCRCRRCETRRVLKRHPDEYIYQPACRVCGARSYRVDKWMMQRDTFGQACTCSGYWFWHRRGSKRCWFESNGEERNMTEQVKEAQEGISPVQQQLLADFVNATVRKVLPVTIIGEKATCVFRHVFGFVDNYQYGVDETGNVVVQDMASGNYGMIEGNVLCSLISVYENEIAACKKDEVKQIEPDLLKEAGLVG